MATATASSAAASTPALHSIGGMPHGLGLLTTVASLPPKYRSRYLNIKTKCEIPLDLSVKPMSPQIANDVPMATNFTEVYTEPSVEQASAGVGVAVAAGTGASATPTDAADLLIASIATAVAQEHEQEQQRQRQRKCEEEDDEVASSRERTPPPSYTLATKSAAVTTSKTTTHTPLKRKWVERERAERERETAKKQMKLDKSAELPTATVTTATATSSAAATTTTTALTKKECHTPNKPIRVSDAAPRTVKSQPHSSKSAKNKATRKLKFDEETSSPVSGTIIRPLEDVTDGTMQYSNGDIDPRYNIVEITEETKAELAAIKNVIGDYICKLCRLKFEDAFGLAQHRCACIVLLEYRCPECGKQFNCPANLASHRRWHKPKKGEASAGASATAAAIAKKENRQSNGGNVLPAPSNRKVEELEHTCEQCGKQFKRLAYLRKHQLTHNNNNNNNSNQSSNSSGQSNAKKLKSSTTTQATIAQPLTAPMVLDYQSYASSSASASSVHSFAMHTSPSRYTPPHSADYERTLTMHVAATNAGNRYGHDDGDSLSECSRSSSNSSASSSAGYGRLQIVESGLTEEENIAAAALTNLRNCASVIQHTTMAH